MSPLACCRSFIAVVVGPAVLVLDEAFEPAGRLPEACGAAIRGTGGWVRP